VFFFFFLKKMFFNLIRVWNWYYAKREKRIEASPQN